MCESSKGELVGVQQLACSRRPREILSKPIIGIYKPSYIMKLPTSIWKCQNKRLSIMKNMVLFEAQVWKKIVALSLLSFSLIFLGSLASFFIYLVGRFGFFFFYFLTWDNSLIMMIITLLFTHSSKITMMMTP